MGKKKAVASTSGSSVNKQFLSKFQAVASELRGYANQKYDANSADKIRELIESYNRLNSQGNVYGFTGQEKQQFDSIKNMVPNATREKLLHRVNENARKQEEQTATTSDTNSQAIITKQTTAAVDESVPVPDMLAESAKVLKGEEPTESAKVLKDEEHTESAKVLKDKEPTEPAKVLKDEEPTEPAKVLKDEETTEPAKVLKDDKPAKPPKVLKDDKPAKPPKPAKDKTDVKTAQDNKDVKPEKPVKPAPKKPPMSPEVKYASDLLSAEKSYNEFMQHVSQLTYDVAEKFNNDKKYKKLSSATLQFESALKVAGNQFFKGKERDFTKFATACNKAFADANKEFKQHRDLWFRIPVLARGFLGVIAILTVIPGLVVAKYSKPGLKATFFKTPETKSLPELNAVKAIWDDYESKLPESIKPQTNR